MTADSIIRQIDAAIEKSNTHRLTMTGRLRHIDEKLHQDVEMLLSWEKLDPAEAKRVRDHLTEIRTNLSNAIETDRIEREALARSGRWGSR